MKVGSGIGTSDYVLEEYDSETDVHITTQAIIDEITGSEDYDYLSDDITLDTIISTSLSELNNSISGGLSNGDEIYLFYSNGSRKYEYNVNDRTTIQSINDFEFDNTITSYDNGLLTLQLTHPKYKHLKIYEVWVNGNPRFKSIDNCRKIDIFHVIN